MIAALPPSPIMRFEIATVDGVCGAVIVHEGQQREVRCRADAGPWALQYRCPPARVGDVLEIVAHEPSSIPHLALPLSSCALRVGKRTWPISPLDELVTGMWAHVRVPTGGDVTIVNELLDSPVGTAFVALHLGTGGPPTMIDLDPQARSESLGGSVHRAARAWVRRALWARGACTTGELVLASRPRAGTDWRIYETLNGYYHADELDRSRLPPLPSAIRTWYRDAVADA
jgi:hypothetical protein